MRKKLNEWAKFDRGINAAVVFFLAVIFSLSILSCENIYIGKDRDQVRSELAQSIFEVDSLILTIRMELDSLYSENK